MVNQIIDFFFLICYNIIMKLEYKMVRADHPQAKAGWVSLGELSIYDIERIGKDFIIRVDGIIYKQPDSYLEKLILWDRISK